MAYIDFREAELSGSRHALAPAAPVAIDAQFSIVEWRVIGLARNDDVGSLRTPGRLRRILARLFGSRLESPLADTRLEALRRLAVFAWRDSFNVPPSELAAFHDAGFSADHAELLLESVLAARGRRVNRTVSRTHELVQCSRVGQTATA